jgi:hypothetical protein
VGTRRSLPNVDLWRWTRRQRESGREKALRSHLVLSHKVEVTKALAFVGAALSRGGDRTQGATIIPRLRRAWSAPGRLSLLCGQALTSFNSPLDQRMTNLGMLTRCGPSGISWRLLATWYPNPNIRYKIRYLSAHREVHGFPYDRHRATWRVGQLY